MLADLLAIQVFALMMVFVRLGATFMILPTIGEAYISPQVRLLFALTFSIIVTPIVQDKVPAIPSTGIMAITLLIAAEILVGVFLGAMVRIMVAALSTAGMVISVITGFANALLFNPGLDDQGSLQSVLLTMLGTLLIFATELHHVMLAGLVESYQVFQPGVMPPVGDFAQMIARGVADSFILAMKLASPFIVIGTTFYALLGLLARLMPQLQVFFLAMPLQILLGLVVLLITVQAIMMTFLGDFSDGLTRFISFN